MSRILIALAVLLAVGFGIAGHAVAPHAIDAGTLISVQDDPVRLADHALAKVFTRERAAQEIDAALKGGDPGLAQSFLDLANERGIPVPDSLAERVAEANSPSATTTRGLRSFAYGLVTGEPDDMVGLAGTAVGDLFVFGDIRDAGREGYRLATGEKADELVLGLACVGLAVTAGTYATAGAGTPARVGLSLVKAARKTGQMSERLAAWMARSVRDVVDWTALKRAFANASVLEPTVAVRAAREAVKMNKADGLVRMVGDIGRVQGKAGTKAALDAMKLADNPADMARMARLAEAKGGKTRAILKTLGRGAIVLTTSLFNLTMWLFWALFTVLGFIASLKRAAERSTERYCHRRRVRRLARQKQDAAAAACEAPRAPPSPEQTAPRPPLRLPKVGGFALATIER